MGIQQIVFLLILFLVVCLLAFLGMSLFSAGTLRSRLRRFMGRQEPSALEGTGWVERVARVAEPFTKLSLPEDGWEKSALRTRFMNAGWRRRAAPTLFFASKSILALLVPLVQAITIAVAGLRLPGDGYLFFLFLGAAIGYYLPNALLARMARRRQREIFETIPDAIDLLTVCVEAGLSLERALVKVASEIHIKSVTLAQELQLVLMEMRAGFTKEKALRNFALRTGVDDVDTLVAMLVQSERFGTSMGASLRVHSENLRTRRRMMAEEEAAKISLKLMFPLIFCIFPTLLMVLLGPAIIQVSAALGPAIEAAR